MSAQESRRFFVIVCIFLVLSATAVLPASAASPQLPSWSVGMFTVDRCQWLWQRHCRWVATELNFYPDASRVTITFKGKVVSGLVMTLDESSPKRGHRAYGWGVPTTFAATNPDWRNNRYWRLYYRW